MAFTADTVWEVRQGGADDQGGGFDAVSGTPGTDRTLQDAVHATFTDLVIDGTTNTDCTSAATPFASDDVGNVINITSGTNFTVQRVQIMSVAGVVATCDKSLGTLSSTGGNGKLGGALGTPGKLTDVIDISGQVAYIKYNATAYLMATSTPGAAGPLTLATNMNNKNAHIIGYDTTRTLTNNDTNRPTHDANAQTGVVMIQTSGSFNTGHHVIRNIKCDGQDGAGTTGFRGDTSGYMLDLFDNCWALDCPTGFDLGQADIAYRCLAESCATAGFLQGGVVSYCRADTCGLGFDARNSSTAISYDHCIAHDCTSHGYEATGFSYRFLLCIAYSNSGDGFKDVYYAMETFQQCVSYGNTLYQFNHMSTRIAEGFFYGNASNSAGSGRYNNTPREDVGGILLTADPFVNPTANPPDFNINDTVGGGALLRAVTLVMP